MTEILSRGSLFFCIVSCDAKDCVVGYLYVRNLGRCFVAIVDIEADGCAVCLAELDAVQSEADRQADVRCPTLFWSGRRAGNKQSPDNGTSHYSINKIPNPNGSGSNSQPSSSSYTNPNNTDTQILAPKRNNIQFARISFNAVGFNAIMNTYIVKFREVCL